MKRYFRPLGLLAGAAARDAIATGLALPLPGSTLAYALVENITRTGTQIERRIIPSTSADPGWAVAVGPEQGGKDPADRIMGIVNATPDSFSDGGLHFDTASAIAHAAAMIRAGARIIDIGGESTRPGATPVDPQDEIQRILPVVAGIRAIADAAGAIISIDTRNAQTMQAALSAGAGMINDVSALTHDPASLGIAATANVPVVLMHMAGEPETMQRSPTYRDVAHDIYDYLEARIAAAEAAGIARTRIIADPGIGFGKTTAHNLALLDQLTLFHGLGVPLLIGVSRKGFIARLSEDEPADRRLPGSLAGALAAIRQGARFVRVHDVPDTIQALRVQAALDDGGV